MQKRRTADTADTQKPSELLNAKLRASAQKLSIPLIEGVIHSSDVFYRTAPAAPGQPLYWQACAMKRAALP